MKIIHNSRNIEYKNPFGALPAGSDVKLSLDIEKKQLIKGVYLSYLYGLEDFHSGRMYMDNVASDGYARSAANFANVASDGYADSTANKGYADSVGNVGNVANVAENGENTEFLRYTCRLPLPEHPCLLFYWFEIADNEGIVYGVKEFEEGRDGAITSANSPNLLPHGGIFPHVFQITVYDRNFKIPDWVPKRIMYQIFPDRFARGSDFPCDKNIPEEENEERIYHESWHEDVDYKGKDSAGYRALDFFGGTLRGISENLDYLKELNVDLIYLNPVFKGRTNHRYDTGDYFQVDPLLGGDDALDELITKAGGMGINIILDGVFSHTGSDSLYFNKLGRYPGIGAYQDALGHGKSPWFHWYEFNVLHGEINYKSWWGFPNLPNIDKMDLTFRNYILGENGVVRYWLEKGIKGWRLDVSDELPDDFLKDLRASAKSQDSQSFILGEVWENASNKISYGNFRAHLLGNTHDGVMGYPFRDYLLNWLRGNLSLQAMVNGMETIREHYPLPAFMANMNHIGTHDTVRAITYLAGEKQRNSREWQSLTFLSREERDYGISLLKLAFLVQFTFPGVPSIYYGDELAMEGYSDPFCRRTLDLDSARNNPPEILERLRSLTSLRKERDNLATGYIEFISNEDNILMYRRFALNGSDVLGNQTDDSGEYLVAVNPDNRHKRFVYKDVDWDIGPLDGYVLNGTDKIFEI